MWVSGLQIKLARLESLLLKAIALAFLIKSSPGEIRAFAVKGKVSVSVTLLQI